MNDEIHAAETLISPGDTWWAIAGKVPVSALEACRTELNEWLQGEGSRVVSGKDGFAALLVFGGPAEGEEYAIELSQRYKTPAYMIDFDDNYPYIQEHHRGRVVWKRGYPAAFLAARGIIAPGYEPRPPSPVKAVSVVEGITVAQARKVVPTGADLFSKNSRGVLVDDRTGMVGISVAMRLRRRCYTAFYDREDRTFSCVIGERGKPDYYYSLGRPNPNYEPIDAILRDAARAAGGRP